MKAQVSFCLLFFFQVHDLCVGLTPQFLKLPEATDSGAPLDDVCVLGWADFNAPWARTKENATSLCKAMAALNEGNPKNNACIMVCPDLARDSSLRGLYDEERQLFEELFSLAQSIESRWVEVYARENRRAETKSNSRRFGTGRIVTSATDIDNNIWLDSELAVYGRVVGQNETVEGAPLAILPRTASLLIPEPASPDPQLLIAQFHETCSVPNINKFKAITRCYYAKVCLKEDWCEITFSAEDNVRIQDRLRPSNEQQSAQKGCKRLEMLLESILRNTKASVVLLVNLTGYVEELAVAAAWIS